MAQLIEVFVGQACRPQNTQKYRRKELLPPSGPSTSTHDGSTQGYAHITRLYIHNHEKVIKLDVVAYYLSL